MAYKHVDADSSGGGDGSGWDLSGASAAYTLAEFDTWAEANFAAGDTAFFKKATAAYTFTSHLALSTRDASSASPINIIGVKEGTTNVGANIVLSDWAVAASDRPSLNGGSYYFYPGDYYIVRNIIFTSSNTSWSVFSGASNLFENCDLRNSGTGPAIYGSNGVSAINCYLSAPSDYGFRGQTNCRLIFCHIDGCSTGVYMPNTGMTLDHCVISDCTTGIDFNTQYQWALRNCTIDDCTSGIIGSTGDRGILINNIISNCTDGWKVNNSGTVIGSIFFDFNNWYGNTKDMSWDNGTSEDNSAKGINDTANNPNYTAAGSDDYSLASGDCIDGGQSLTLGIG